MDIASLSDRLAASAEAVCRHYLPNGRRAGRYWIVGDVAGSPGRSLFVRLASDGGRRAGRWSDAATGEYGDLLDIIRTSAGCTDLAAAIEEAVRFLSYPDAGTSTVSHQPSRGRSDIERRSAARRLWDRAVPLRHTLASRYLAARGLIADDEPNLRFHPSCLFRDDADATRQLPAMIAAVRDGAGEIVAVHRTWLSSDPPGKADIKAPRRALGPVLGHGVPLGADSEPRIAVTGEGLETVLSVRAALPTMGCIAALSAGHLGGLDLRPDLERLYIAADRNTAGREAARRLAGVARSRGIETIILRSRGGDFNDDLREDGIVSLRARLVAQLAPEDAPDVER